MRNSKSKVQCTKRQLSKCADPVCRTYSAIQTAYAEMLNLDESVENFRCNVSLPGFSLTDGLYTTDFLITLTDGELAVAECCRRDYLGRPLHIRLLDASRAYWLRRGVKPENWRLIINAKQ